MLPRPYRQQGSQTKARKLLLVDVTLSVSVLLVLQAIGVRPEVGLAKSAGLELGARGGIKVDDHMRTSDPSIYAVGDAVEVKDW